MILSDAGIRQSLRQGLIEVHPAPQPEQIQPASLDVRLGHQMYDPESDTYFAAPEHTLVPGRRYLGTTMEEIELPNQIAAQLAGRSTIGRKGVIVHKTAGWIDPGFSGELTLELLNLGDEPVTLRGGDRIAQLVFMKLDQPSSGYDGQYQNQSGPTEANQ